MKRFHVHVSVPDLQQGVAFYSRMFGIEPAVAKPDYAKWLLDDPQLNFAISARGASPGINHLGFQAESDEERALLRRRAQRADPAVVDEAGANCCYAHSDKHWVTDPANVAWEIFHTLADIPVFGEVRREATAPPPASACCAPRGDRSAAPPAEKSACCAPH